MVRKIRISSRADNDFIKITEYLETNWSLKEIRKFKQLFESKLEIIKHFPFGYPSVSKKINVRRCVLIKQISIYYEIKESEIVILTLFDNRQAPDKLTLT